MEIFVILFSTIIVLYFSGIVIIDDTGFNNKSLVFILFLLYQFLVFFCLLYNLNKPKAIDVYRGKTTLEIIYKDRMPIDSTVVWKNK